MDGPPHHDRWNHLMSDIFTPPDAPPPPAEPVKKRGGWPAGRPRKPKKPLVKMYPDRAPPPAPKPPVVLKEPDPPAPAGEFAGMTPRPEANCCDDCFALRCVITGMAYCGHPHKSGLQAISMGNDAVRKRYARAISYLKKAMP